MVPALPCKFCGESQPVESNAGFAGEVAPLSETDGLWAIDEPTTCKTPDCRNVGRSTARHPREYARYGHSR